MTWETTNIPIRIIKKWGSGLRLDGVYYVPKILLYYPLTSLAKRKYPPRLVDLTKK